MESISEWSILKGAETFLLGKNWICIGYPIMELLVKAKMGEEEDSEHPMRIASK